ncbi:hypothetical protein WMF31_33110 [Sorangium sp. So ce1036]|uniref:hypothetical protein n=1 Tax=Sorangium sp. So ce1036 TaxID=3133328 RepID=UPI003F0F573C
MAEEVEAAGDAGDEALLVEADVAVLHGPLRKGRSADPGYRRGRREEIGEAHPPEHVAAGDPEQLGGEAAVAEVGLDCELEVRVVRGRELLGDDGEGAGVGAEVPAEAAEEERLLRGLGRRHRAHQIREGRRGVLGLVVVHDPVSSVGWTISPERVSSMDLLVLVSGSGDLL